MSVFIHNVESSNVPAEMLDSLIDEETNFVKGDKSKQMFFDELSFERQQEVRNNAKFAIYTVHPEGFYEYQISESINDQVRTKDLIVMMLVLNSERQVFTENEEFAISSGSNVLSQNGGKVFKTVESLADYINEYDELMS